LYTAAFGSSPDKVFASQDKHPFVAGEFVWSGWDYLGEPTPYYSARSSYCGIIDLAGFKKDRFYLYQSRWRPGLPMVHILPHWNWPDRIGQTTPVHIFTSGDEAELFLNGHSLGKKKKEAFEYRLRWDDVKYEPGELKVIAYKNGKKWAEDVIKTTSGAAQLILAADRDVINADGDELSFITVTIADKNRLTVPTANNNITFSVQGPGEIIATDNGDPANLVPFASKEREAYFGKLLAIVRSIRGKPGNIIITARSSGLKTAILEIKSK
jgi:beta-galactosidase